MTYGEIGIEALRAENVDRIVKGFALQKFVMKQVVMQQTSGAWQESYYRETDTELTANAQIGRGAAFPTMEASWEKNSAYMKKAGLEGVVPYEDTITDNIDVIARTQLRIARAVVKSVDTTIWNALSENQAPTNIQTYAIAPNFEFDSATLANRRPHEDIANAVRLVAEKGYTADTLILSPKDYWNVITNDNIISSFNPDLSATLLNGRMGRLLGLDVLVSNVVTADKALVCESKTCGTYRVAQELKTIVKENEGINTIIRAFELGAAFVTDPKSICLITNTQK